MRTWPPSWPPQRRDLTRLSIQLHSLFMLPTRKERRPRLSDGPHSASHAYVSWLSGESVATQIGQPSNPSIVVELHAIGGFCCVSPSLPAPRNAARRFALDAVNGNGEPRGNRNPRPLVRNPRPLLGILEPFHLWPQRTSTLCFLVVVSLQWPRCATHSRRLHFLAPPDERCRPRGAL